MLRTNVEMPHISKLAHSCPLFVVGLWVKCIILSVNGWYCLSLLNHCFHHLLCVNFVACNMLARLVDF